MTKPMFWNKMADRYAARAVSDPAAYATTLARTRSYLGPDDTVLEIGCGTGSTALALADAVGRMIATDYAEGMIDIARRKTEAAGVANLGCEVADANLSGYEPGRFDAVLAFNLIHLLPDPEAAIARVHAVLKPGGHFISKTVCLAGNPVFPVIIGAMRLVGKAPYVGMLRPAALHRMITRAGFEIVETADHNKGTQGHFIVARRI